MTQDPSYSVAGDSSDATTGGWLLPTMVLGIVFVLLAAPAGAFSGYRAVKELGGLVPGLFAPGFSTPGATTRELDQGTYSIFEKTGTQRQNGPVQVKNIEAPTLQPADVQVTGPNGPVRTTGFGNGSETITRDPVIYTAFTKFKVQTPGKYRIEIGGEQKTNVIVARSIGSSFGNAAPWIGFTMLSAAGFGIGIALIMYSRPQAGKRKIFS